MFSKLINDCTQNCKIMFIHALHTDWKHACHCLHNEQSGQVWLCANLNMPVYVHCMSSCMTPKFSCSCQTDPCMVLITAMCNRELHCIVTSTSSKNYCLIGGCIYIDGTFYRHSDLFMLFVFSVLFFFDLSLVILSSLK